MATSVISLAVILIFWIGDKDPVLNLFYWFSGLAVLAIVFVEILVSVAVIAFFARHRGEVSILTSIVAPLASVIGLAVGLWLLASRFALLAGTVDEGVDPTTESWGLNTTGWVLVLLPFVTFAVGMLVGKLRVRTENEDAIADLVS